MDKELAQYLEQKFGHVDQRFDGLTAVFATKEDFNDLKQDVNGLRESVQALTIAVDRLAKTVEDLHQEFIMMMAKVDRHEKWLHLVAEKLGIKLEY